MSEKRVGAFLQRRSNACKEIYSLKDEKSDPGKEQAGDGQVSPRFLRPQTNRSRMDRPQSLRPT